MATILTSSQFVARVYARYAAYDSAFVCPACGCSFAVVIRAGQEAEDDARFLAEQERHDATDDQWLSYMSMDEGIALLSLFDAGGLFWVGSMAYTLAPQCNRWAVDDLMEVEVPELHSFVFAAEVVISERLALLAPFYASSDRLRAKLGMITSNDIPF